MRQTDRKMNVKTSKFTKSFTVLYYTTFLTMNLRGSRMYITQSIRALQVDYTFIPEINDVSQNYLLESALLKYMWWKKKYIRLFSSTIYKYTHINIYIYIYIYIIYIYMHINFSFILARASTETGRIIIEVSYIVTLNTWRNNPNEDWTFVG